jgi:DnaJ family protein A protein 1/DnaJ family protein A protein 2
MAEIDYYKILELDRDASQDDINKSYRLLALKYHPDRNPSDEAKIIFQQISEAKDVLTDQTKKALYDKFGHAGLSNKNMFRPMQKQTVRTGNPLIVSLADALNPMLTELKYDLKKNVLCTSCASNVAPYTSIPCTTCKGLKYIVQVESLDVKVPPHYLRKPITIIEDAGPMINGFQTDLAIDFKLNLPKDYHITTDLKLMHTVRINFSESVCGFAIKYVHPTGKIFVLFAKRGLVINPNAIYILEDLGLHGEELYVNFVITYPEQVTLQQNVALSFNNLEHALGPRNLPNEVLNDYTKEQILFLDQLKKIIKMDEADEVDEDEHAHAHYHQHQHPFHQHGSHVQCNQQ